MKGAKNRGTVIAISRNLVRQRIKGRLRNDKVTFQAHKQEGVRALLKLVPLDQGLPFTCRINLKAAA